jgi:hypothetical protein
MPQDPPGTIAPFGVTGWQIPAPARSSHQSWAGQSVSTLQAVPQAPLVALQNGPAWLGPAQVVLLVQAPHAPVAVQYGLAVPGHASVAVVPSSPLHAAHVFDVESHTGVIPEQVLLVAHATHLPTFGPVLAQMPERQTTETVPAVHTPSPFA